MASLMFRTSVALLTFAIISTSFLQAKASPVQGLSSNSTELVAPLSVPPDGVWDGIDGSWSSFTLRVGTPAQDVRVFLSWASYQTWVVLPQGCTTASDVESCSSLRGGTFDPTNSSTWDRVGYYYLGVEEDLGYNGDGLFGYDTVGLGSDSTALPTMNHTTVGGVALNSYYLGILGINPLSTNFTTLKDSSPSYLTLLRNNHQIPSLSFGYTAGAIYRSSGIYGSLTLGGYDKSRIVENAVEFNMSASPRGGTLAALRSISTPSQIAADVTPVELLPDGVYVTLDATVPQIWLPVQACQAFENEFGLVYDQTTDLYLVNDTQHAALLQRNPNVTFELSPPTNQSQTVSITLPYAAFDLTAQPPYQGISTNMTYFPLRRALKDDQITLGRVFFQEAYISVDFERQTFSLSQVNWNDESSQDLVAIKPYHGPNTLPSNNTNHGLSSGEIAGVVTGAIGLVILIALLFTWLWRRRTMNIGAKNASVTKLLTTGEDSPKSVSEKEQPQKISVMPDKTTLDLPPAVRGMGVSAPVTREGAHFRSGSGSPYNVRSGAQSPLRQVSNAHDVDTPSSFVRTSISRRDQASGAVTATTSATHTPTGRRSPAIYASGGRGPPSSRSSMVRNSVEGRTEGGMESLSRLPPPAAESTFVTSKVQPAEEVAKEDDDDDATPPDIERHPRRSESLQGRVRRSLERRNSSSSAKSAATVASKSSKSKGQEYYSPDERGRYSSTNDPTEITSATNATDPGTLTALPIFTSTPNNHRRLRPQRSLSQDEGSAPLRSRVRFLDSNGSGDFTPSERPISLWTATQATPGNPILTRPNSSNGRASPIAGLVATMDSVRPRPSPGLGGGVRRNSTGRASLVGVEETISAKLGMMNGLNLDLTTPRPETRTPPKPLDRPMLSRQNSSGRSSLIGIDSRQSIMLPAFDFEVQQKQEGL